MFRSVIAPMQAWLMSQGRCVGCGMPLVKAKEEKHSRGRQVTCKCGRIYIQDTETSKYRRALENEVK